MKNINTEIEQIADQTKRNFIKKFGSYAASVPLAGFVLMTPETSIASCSSHPGGGHGGGHHGGGHGGGHHGGGHH